MRHVATVGRSLFIPFLDQRDILFVRKTWISLQSSVCRTNFSDFPLNEFVSDRFRWYRFKEGANTEGKRVVKVVFSPYPGPRDLNGVLISSQDAVINARNVSRKRDFRCNDTELTLKKNSIYR